MRYPLSYSKSLKVSGKDIITTFETQKSMKSIQLVTDNYRSLTDKFIMYIMIHTLFSRFFSKIDILFSLFPLLFLSYIQIVGRIFPLRCTNFFRRIKNSLIVAFVSYTGCIILIFRRNILYYIFLRIVSNKILNCY